MKRFKTHLLAFCAAAALTVLMASSAAAIDGCDDFLTIEDEGIGGTTYWYCILTGADDDWCYFDCVS
jgi:hypothetical protein